MNSEISFRPATEADREWLFHLKRATLRTYVEQVFGGWDDADQRQRFNSAFLPARLRVIRSAEEDVGLLEWEERDDAFFLGRIEILPARQGRGIGRTVLAALAAEADRVGKPVLLQVLRPNPARRLYERMGYRVCGETATHFQMRREPAPVPGVAGAPVTAKSIRTS